VNAATEPSNVGIHIEIGTVAGELKGDDNEEALDWSHLSCGADSMRLLR
jgi:hypothetical protein